MKGDGSFDSQEGIELIKEADIIVTNPPFSLFRKFITTLEKYNKKYLIIGNMNSLHHKDIFPLIKENKVWYGVSIHSGGRDFKVPDDYPLNAQFSKIDEFGNKFICVKGVRWYTNLENGRSLETLDLCKHYSPEEYPTYDNYDAINVNKTCDIPMDYNGVMGVPITFFDKYNPTQFEIVGILLNGSINGKNIYARILIHSIR